MATEQPEEITIIVPIKRKQTLALPCGNRIRIKRPSKHVRKGSVVLVVPRGTRVERA